MNIGIYYSRVPKGDDPSGGYLYGDNPQRKHALRELLEEMKKLSDNAVIVCGDSYIGDNTFSSYWLPSPDSIGYLDHIDTSITIDALYDKGYFRGDATFAMMNIAKMRKIGRDKSRQAELFGKYQPYTKVAEKVGLVDAIMAVPTDRVVIKPLNKNGGRDILIEDKHTVINKIEGLEDGKWIVQAFIDSASGIPNMVDGVHDLRVYVVDGEQILASIREPKKGSLVANTNMGGSIKFFPASAIPEEAAKITMFVDDVLKAYGNRYYSADFIFDGSQWFLLEINDRPGIPARFQTDLAQAAQESIARSIADSVNNELNKIGKK
jgi:hypothetical protein